MSKDNLSWDDLEVICSNLPKTVVGIVCRPDTIETIRRVASIQEKSNPVGGASLFWGIPLHTKHDQVEPWRAFYDLKELQEYLNS